MKQINAWQLASIMTFITVFMLDHSTNTKTFAQLLDIFEASCKNMKTDQSDDLRILRFSDDMERGNWDSDIVISCKQGIAVDGIHRGVAYLWCVRKDVSESTLPKVLICNS